MKPQRNRRDPPLTLVLRPPVDIADRIVDEKVARTLDRRPRFVVVEKAPGSTVVASQSGCKRGGLSSVAVIRSNGSGSRSREVTKALRIAARRAGSGDRMRRETRRSCGGPLRATGNSRQPARPVRVTNVTKSAASRLIGRVLAPFGLKVYPGFRRLVTRWPNTPASAELVASTNGIPTAVFAP